MNLKTTDTTTTAPFVERRGAERKRMFKGGTLSFNKGYAAFECIVKNVSETGARLTFGETPAVPPRFDLAIKDEEGRKPATVRWRTGTAIGVSFD